MRSLQTYNENSRGNIKTLLLDSKQHLVLQSTDLIQNINNLTTGVGIAQDISLGEVAVRREDHNIENHRDNPEEILQCARVRCLEEI